MLSFLIGKTKVNISFSFTVCITLLAVLDKTGLLFVSLFAVFFHEIGHYIALQLLGIKDIEISFVLTSVKLLLREQLSNKKSAIIAIAGPTVNLLLSSLLLHKNYYIKYFGVANFILFLFNMLPVANLDGGDIAKYLLCILFKNKAEKMFCIVSILVLTLVLTPVGVFFMLKYNNPTVILVSIYLIIMSYIKV